MYKFLYLLHIYCCEFQQSHTEGNLHGFQTHSYASGVITCACENFTFAHLFTKNEFKYIRVFIINLT